MRQYKYISIGFAWILTLGSILSSPAVSGETTSRVWLVGGEHIIEYDPSTWNAVRRIEIPENISGNPDMLQISRSGAMIFSPDPHTSSTPGKAWIWDGMTSLSLDTRCIRETVSSVECRESIHESCPRIALSSDGRKLFWFANEFETVKEVDGPDISVSTTFRVRQTDLSGSDPVELVNFSFPPCSCETGACMETCPEASFWFSREGIDDFFIVNHYIPGQLGSTFLASYTYRHTRGTWLADKHNQTFENILDADSGGDMIIHAFGDSGCCGWDNESSDRTIISSDNKDTVIFNEWERFSNRNYDVSFYTSKARLSPDRMYVAVNIAATHRSGEPVHLSSVGKENTAELDHIQQAMKTMPMVEVIQASGPTPASTSIPNAILIGWLNNREILAVQRGTLIQCDIPDNRCRNTPVKVDDGSFLYVR